MKTQQRSFVVEIKSARRKSKMAPKSIWGDTDFTALVREAEALPLFGNDIVADASSRDEDRAPDPEAPEEPADTDVGDEPQAEASLIEPDQSLSAQQDEDAPFSAVSQKQVTPPKQRLKRASERRRDKRLEPLVGEGSDASTALTPLDHSEPSSDELALLEEENRHLKSLLATRLRQQNLQLRKMLERFAIA